jgi:hypothetical protein
MAHVLWLLTAAAFSSDLVHASEGATCKPGEAAAEVTEFGKNFSPAIVLDKRYVDQPRRVEHGLQDIKVAAMRILLAIGNDVSDRDWTITIRNARNGVLASFDPLDFQDAGGALTIKRWTGRFDESEIFVELQARKETDLVVEILEGLATPSTADAVRLYSIQGDTATWQPLYSAPLEIARAGDPTGIMVTGHEVPPGSKSSPGWCCSGTMISHDLFLTNWHCGGNSGGNSVYWTADVCERAVIDLGWSNESLSRQYSCKQVVAKDRDLDYAILRVLPVLGPAGHSSRPPRSRIARAVPKDDQDIFLVHHANCSFKLISRECRIQKSGYRSWTGRVDPDDHPLPDFTHDCDTESGASGGPVFDLSGSVIGIHHAGFDRDKSCKPVDRVNKAVSIAAILHHLRREYRAVAAELERR